MKDLNMNLNAYYYFSRGYYYGVGYFAYKKTGLSESLSRQASAQI